ncbi:hypothetical protein BT69DRAFT_274246 [Atractiella rhizophila]|nr:hypothetical protein BT69DRAFT_274246 [Atractiella rhizophila]
MGTSNKNTQVTALCGGTSVESVNLSTCTAVVSTTSLSTPTSGKTRKSGVVSTTSSTTSKSTGKRTREKYSCKSVLEIRPEPGAHGPASDESDEKREAKRSKKTFTRGEGKVDVFQFWRVCVSSRFLCIHFCGLASMTGTLRFILREHKAIHVCFTASCVDLYTV